MGIGSCVPHTEITNRDLENAMETSDEWIRTRTGIAKRRVLTHTKNIDNDEEVNSGSLQSLGIEAGKAALAMSGLKVEEIDLVICATSSPDNLFGDAAYIASCLECKNAFGFDLTAACSGFLFGVITAGQYLDRSGSGVKNALVIGADALTRWVDWDDRNSCILFGDGAGAMVLSSSLNNDSSSSLPGILGYSMHSRGSGNKYLALNFAGEKRHIATPGDGVDISSGGYNFITMNGREVYKFATREVPTVIEEALEAANISPDQLDWLLLHQANIRIMEIVAQRLGIPMEKVISNLSDYGNTSAGSIPLALDEAVRQGKVKKGHIVACAGFGAGLSWGSAILRW